MNSRLGLEYGLIWTVVDVDGIGKGEHLEVTKVSEINIVALPF